MNVVVLQLPRRFLHDNRKFLPENFNNIFLHLGHQVIFFAFDLIILMDIMGRRRSPHLFLSPYKPH